MIEQLGCMSGGGTIFILGLTTLGFAITSFRYRRMYFKVVREKLNECLNYRGEAGII